MEVKNPKLWSPDTPYLYRVQSRLKKGNQSIDGGITRVGIRLAEFRGKDGFWLNGKPFGQLVEPTVIRISLMWAMPYQTPSNGVMPSVYVMQDALLSVQPIIRRTRLSWMHVTNLAYL